MPLEDAPRPQRTGKMAGHHDREIRIGASSAHAQPRTAGRSSMRSGTVPTTRTRPAWGHLARGPPQPWAGCVPSHAWRFGSTEIWLTAVFRPRPTWERNGVRSSATSRLRPRMGRGWLSMRRLSRWNCRSARAWPGLAWSAAAEFPGGGPSRAYASRAGYARPPRSREARRAPGGSLTRSRVRARPSRHATFVSRMASRRAPAHRGPRRRAPAARGVACGALVARDSAPQLLPLFPP